MIIVTETKNGSAFPYSAYACNDEADFIDRISALALQRRSDEAFNIETVQQAINYLDETFAQTTEIITQNDFCAGESNKVDAAASRLGWLETDEN